ncbi:MAG TPA: hypothetical protein VGP83_13980 [Pyrinomonadaceae bacterium]|nr:hypothetical protein [Pyrinomonadaceae bacterium]
MFLRATVFLILTLSAVPTSSQNRTIVREKSALAAAELQEIVTESAKLDDRLATVAVRARAAALMFYYDAVQSEALFRATWNFANQNIESESVKEQAKLLILKHVIPRNYKLAREFLGEKPKSTDNASADDSSSPLASKLAANLMDVDPSMAAALLEPFLVSHPTPGAIATLVHLREKDSLLADYIAAKVLDRLPLQPTLISLATLHLFAAYMFPGPDTSMTSIQAEASLESLQLRYFFRACDVLRMSLAETDETLKARRYAPRDLEFRAANQGQVAAILAALAPRLQPTLAAELNAIAVKLSSQVPPNIAQVTRFALARLSAKRFTSDDPEENFAYALTSGDFEAASVQLERITDETKRKSYTQLLIKSEARALLARLDLMAALSKIRKLEDPTARLVMYLDALRVTKRKHEPEITKLIIDEARLLIPQTGRNGLHIRALLSFAAYLEAATDAAEFLDSAVTSINALEIKSSDDDNEAKTLTDKTMRELNNPTNLLDASEMEQAFTSAGAVDLDNGLATAKRIQIRSVQLIARLEVLQGFTKVSMGSKMSLKTSPRK